MIVWKVWDKDFDQPVGLGGRHRTKKAALKEIDQIKRKYKQLGWKTPRIEVKKVEIRYR